MSTALISLAIIPLLSLLAAAAGGNSFAKYLPKWAGGVPEILFGVVIGLAVFNETGSWQAGFFSACWSYAMLELGHSDAYEMGLTPDKAPDVKPNSLDFIVVPIAARLGFKVRSAGYSWLYMGLKGFLIGIPVLPFGAALTVLWPFAYWLGHRRGFGHVKAEYISGAFAGLLTAMYLIT